eukprot:4743106-Pleurochrysis_carterae.AAC.3
MARSMMPAPVLSCAGCEAGRSRKQYARGARAVATHARAVRAAGSRRAQSAHRRAARPYRESPAIVQARDHAPLRLSAALALWDRCFSTIRVALFFALRTAVATAQFGSNRCSSNVLHTEHRRCSLACDFAVNEQR